MITNWHACIELWIFKPPFTCPSLWRDRRKNDKNKPYNHRSLRLGHAPTTVKSKRKKQVVPQTPFTEQQWVIPVEWNPKPPTPTRAGLIYVECSMMIDGPLYNCSGWFSNFGHLIDYQNRIRKIAAERSISAVPPPTSPAHIEGTNTENPASPVS